MKYRIVSRSAFAALLLLIPGSAAFSAEWPQFRGPDGQGHATATDLPISWSETENVVWKTDLPGNGWSSPVIDGDRIWMTSAITTPVSEAEKQRRLEGNTGNQPLSVVGTLSMRALCVDRSTGKLLSEIELMTKAEPEPVHALNSYASPTPVIETGRLYCHFGSYGTACLDTNSGKVLWTNQSLRINHENGPGSSPLMWGRYLIFHCDGSDAQYIAALDKLTGDLAWKTDRSGQMNSDPQLKKAYGTPLIVEIGGQPQLISPAADWLYSYDPATGRELWKLNYGVLGFSIVPRPVAGDGMIYFSTSFMKAEILAVRVGSSAQPEIVWRYKKQAPQMPSPLLIGDRLYFVSDKGVAACLNAETGEEIWTGRLGGNYCASPLLADGRIYFLSREGVTTVVQPGDEFQILATNQLDGSLMASAAAVDHALFLRSDKALYRIERREGIRQR